MKRFLVIGLSILTCVLCMGQIRTRVVDNKINTLRVRYADASSLNRPFLVLDERSEFNTDHVLEISFDELSHNKHNYSYTIEHCNADGTNSSLSSNEYLDGFDNADIDDYDYSVNTQQLYIHYRFTFPNAGIRPTVSGQYKLIIYEDNDRDNIVGEVSFYIIEPMAEITANVHANTSLELNGKYQQLDVTTTFAATNSGRSVADDYFIVVQQNNRTDNMVFAPRPSYISNNQLIFKNHRQLIFEGGMEYHHFDISSVYFKGNNVDRIDFDHRFYHAFLFADNIRATDPYLSDYDANGQYVINAERTDDDDYEADYMYVHFFVPSETQWLDGNVYVIGDAFENKLDEFTRMTYDNEHKAYVFTRYLKQGGYDYQYAFYNTRRNLTPINGATLTRVEGSHWQANNEYAIYVYHRPFGARYDQLIGLYVIK